MYNTEINKINLVFETSPELFSPASADRGTLAMLSLAEISENDIVLDLGCGCGTAGVYAARIASPENVVMCDILPAAVELSRKNAALNGCEGVTVLLSDGLADITRCDFTVILSNPPYHTDFSVAKGFIENGYRHLTEGGRMLMVTKRLDWYKNKLTSVFGGVKVSERDGYFVFIAEKRPLKRKPIDKNKNALSKKLAKKAGRRSRR